MTLPEGWTEEPCVSQRRHELVVVSCPDGHMRNYVTIDFTRRCFRGGQATEGPGQTTTNYAMRGWRDRLRKDAIDWLSDTTKFGAFERGIHEAREVDRLRAEVDMLTREVALMRPVVEAAMRYCASSGDDAGAICDIVGSVRTYRVARGES